MKIKQELTTDFPNAIDSRFPSGSLLYYPDIKQDSIEFIRPINMKLSMELSMLIGTRIVRANTTYKENRNLFHLNSVCLAYSVFLQDQNTVISYRK